MPIIEKNHLGAIMGALVGDAAGSVLEFFHGRITTDIVLNAMSMPGGGVLNVAPGQITDDGELTLALGSVLFQHCTESEYPMNKVATSYSDWYKSGPFDVGMTCGKAFGSIVLAERESTVENPGVYMCAHALKYNSSSEANGALMRATPIAVFYHNLPYERISEYARLDARLSHPNIVCQDVNALYCIAIAYLINNPGDNTGAYELVKKWEGICPIVVSWLDVVEKLEDLDEMNCKINIGHVKHAFTLAMYFLKKGTTYEDAIRTTLMKGGDSDTNSCICGGLISAHYGIDGIPEYMKKKVLEFDPVNHDPYTTLCGYNRPEIYRSSNIFGWIL
jgi:ADP-ribosyl-[dinitrogen reductase] hydrolase